MREYFLKTERIGFSWWKNDDLPLAKDLWSDPQVSRYISKNGVFSISEIEDKLTNQLKDAQLYHVQYWPIFRLSDHEFMGCCGLRTIGLRKEFNKDVYEIGAHLKSKFWGQGIAYEAASKVLDYAFNTLNAVEIYAGHNPHNINSKKVLNKLGFNYVFDSFYPPTGLMHPTYLIKR